MPTFIDLIHRTTAWCNKRGKSLAIGVLIVGGLSIVLGVFMWKTSVQIGLQQLQTVIGPEATEQLKAQLDAVRNQQEWAEVLTSAGQEFFVQHLETLPQTEQQKIVTTFALQTIL